MGVLRLVHQAGVARVRAAAGGGLPRLADRGVAAGVRRQPGRHDAGRAIARRLLRRARPDPAVDGVRGGDRAAAGLDRARVDQEPADRRAGDHARALAHAPLRAAPEPRVLPERLRRPCRQQGDAGGARAAGIGGAGDRRHLVRRRAVGGRRGGFRGGRPAPAGAAAGVARRLHRRVVLLRAAHQGALDGGGRGALHAGRAHRRQLHQYPDRQAVRPRRARGFLCARGAAGPDGQVAGFAAPRHHHGLRVVLAQRPADRRRERTGHLAVEPRCGEHRRHRGRHRPHHAHRRHVGMDPVGGRRHLREHGRGAGGHGDHQPCQPGRRPARQQGAGGEPRRHPLRAHELPLRAADRRRHGAAGRHHPRLLAAHRRRREGRPGRDARARASRRSSTCCCASTISSWGAS